MDIKIFLSIILIFLEQGLAREERYLIFENTGVFKLVVGVGIPININKKGTSLNWLSNIQAVYKLPDNVKYYEPSVIRSEKSMRNGVNGDLFFAVLSKIFHRLGLSQVECFREFMCEMEELQRTENFGLFEEIWQVVVTQLLKSSASRIMNHHGQNRSLYIDGRCKTFVTN